MASFYSDALLYKKPLSTHSTTLPKIRLPRRGKKRLPVVRLGSRQKSRRQGGGSFFLSRYLRRVRFRWLRLQYCCMVKKLKKYYKSVIKDVIEGGAFMEVCHQQRVLMESSMAVTTPAFGGPVSTFSSSKTVLQSS